MCRRTSSEPHIFFSMCWVTTVCCSAHALLLLRISASSFAAPCETPSSLSLSSVAAVPVAVAAATAAMFSATSSLDLVLLCALHAIGTTGPFAKFMLVVKPASKE